LRVLRQLPSNEREAAPVVERARFGTAVGVRQTDRLLVESAVDRRVVEMLRMRKEQVKRARQRIASESMYRSVLDGRHAAFLPQLAQVEKNIALGSSVQMLANLN
jgi:hypothetical protein